MARRSIQTGAATTNRTTTSAALPLYTTPTAISTASTNLTGALDRSGNQRPIMVTTVRTPFFTAGSTPVSILGFLSNNSPGSGTFSAVAQNSIGTNTLTHTMNFATYCGDAANYTTYSGFRKNTASTAALTFREGGTGTTFLNGSAISGWAALYGFIDVDSVPSAPQNLYASVINPTSVTIDWSMPSDQGSAAGLNSSNKWRIILYNLTTQSKTVVHVGLEDGAYFDPEIGAVMYYKTLTGLTTNVTYLVYVAALNNVTDAHLSADGLNYFNIGAHAGSNAILGVTPTTPPVDPTGSITAALSNNNTAITVTYSLSTPTGSGPTDWTLYRDYSDIIDSGTLLEGSSITNATYVDDSVTPGSTYNYSLYAINSTGGNIFLTTAAITVPEIVLGGYTASVGSTALSPFTGAQAANTDYTTGVTFNSGIQSGAFISGSFTTLKPIYVAYVTNRFRSGGSGTVQLQVTNTANPGTRYYQRTSASTTPITIDPDNNLNPKYNPRRSTAYDTAGLLTFTGVKWFAGFRMISGASVLFFRGAGASNSSITTDDTIYQEGSSVPAFAGTSIYMTFEWRTVPNAPSGVTAVPTTGDPTGMDIAWSNGPTDNGGYAVNGWRILYSEAGMDAWESTGKFGGGGTSSYTVTGLTPNTSYDFVVAATSSLTDLFADLNSIPYEDISAHTGTNSSIVTETTKSPSPFKVYDGTDWNDTTAVKVYDGTDWVDAASVTII